jgi:hypothetical protein
MLSAWTFFEAFLVNAFSGNDTERAELAGGAIIAAGFGALAAALVIAFPLMSVVLFAIAGLISLAVAGGGYENHWLYGPVFLLLGIMAFFGWIGKRKERREARAELERRQQYEARMEQFMRQQRDAQRYPSPAPQPSPAPVATPPSNQATCPQCGTKWPQSTKFCGECGSAMPAAGQP